MYQFQCDYNEGAHPRIMERLIETILKQAGFEYNDELHKVW